MQTGAQMDMNSALVPYLLSHASNTVPIRSPDSHLSQDAALRPASGSPASGNIAFYFRNWPFPVDLPDPSNPNAEMRSWHERLASYREASQSAIRDKTPGDASDQPPENPDSPSRAGAETLPPVNRYDAAPGTDTQDAKAMAGNAALNRPGNQSGMATTDNPDPGPHIQARGSRAES